MEKTVEVWLGNTIVTDFDFTFEDDMDEDEILHAALEYVYDILYVTVV